MDAENKDSKIRCIKEKKKIYQANMNQKITDIVILLPDKYNVKKDIINPKKKHQNKMIYLS